MNQTSNQNQDHTRTGLMPLRYGCSVRVATASGVHQQITIKEARLAPKGAKMTARCFHPRCEAKTWKTLDELRAAHPAESIMKRQNEAHPYALAEQAEDGTITSLYSDVGAGG